MNIRRLFFLLLLLLGCFSSLEAAEPDIKISSIAQYWNEDAQKLDFFFHIENRTQQKVDLTCVIMIQTTKETISRNMTFENIGPDSKELYTLSYEPERLRRGDTVHMSINLFGKNFKGFIDRADKEVEVGKVIVADDGRMKMELTEPWPLIEYSPLKPIDFVTKLAWNLAKDIADEKEEEKKGLKAALAAAPIELIEPIVEEEIEPKFLVITTRQPVQGAGNQKPGILISATFDEPINIDTITEDTFYLMISTGKQKGKKLRGNIKTVNGEIIFIPEKPLTYDTAYDVVVTEGLKSLDGNNLEQTESWGFRTLKPPIKKVFGAKKDFLQLGRIYPPVNGKDILVDTKISISFRSEINPDTVNSETFYAATSKNKIAGQLEVRKNKIILSPDEPLAYGSEYRAIATKKIADVAGKSLKGTVRWRFKTRPDIEYPEADDPNILIFSPSHEQISWVPEKDGILKIGITAFDPILHVDVNGSKIAVEEASKIEFEVPYKLKSKSTPFEITTFTQVGKSRKKFTVNFGKKPKPKRPLLQIIGILGLANVDNLDNAPSGSTKSSANKAVITVVPQFNYHIFEDSYLRVKGIILREYFLTDTYIDQSNAEQKSADKATSYTQLAVEWDELDTFLGDLTGGIGWNFIRTNTSSFLGENDVLSETFFSGALKQKISDTSSYNAGLEYKNKNSTAVASDVDNETDAVAITFKGRFDFEFLESKNSAKLTYVSNNAIGKYQVFSSTKLDYNLSYAIGDYTPSVGYSYKNKQMTIENPSKGGVTPFYNASQLTLKLKYKLFSKSVVSFDYKMKNQVSNLADSTYSNNTATLSFTQIY